LRYIRPWQAKRLLFNIFSFSAEQEKEAREMPHRVDVDTASSIRCWEIVHRDCRDRRSQHRSQGMGAPEAARPSHNYLVTIAGLRADHDALDDVDTAWTRVPGGEAVGRILAEAERTFVRGAEKRFRCTHDADRAIDDRWQAQARRTGRGAGAVQRLCWTRSLTVIRRRRVRPLTLNSKPSIVNISGCVGRLLVDLARRSLYWPQYGLSCRQPA